MTAPSPGCSRLYVPWTWGLGEPLWAQVLALEPPQKVKERVRERVQKAPKEALQLRGTCVVSRDQA